MKRFKCQELLVAFNASYHQTVSIKPTDSPGANWLEVEIDGPSLIVLHVRKDGSIERRVKYNYASVKEITADYCSEIPNG